MAGHGLSLGGNAAVQEPVLSGAGGGWHALRVKALWQNRVLLQPRQTEVVLSSSNHP